MRFKLDENMPMKAQVWLQEHGHDADSVFDENLGGANDSAVAMACQTEQRVLVTLDLDFSDIRTYPPSDYCGIIILRPKYQSTIQIMAMLESMLFFLEKETIDHSLWIVEPTGLRIRT